MMSRAVSGGLFWDVCELSMTLGILCAHGWVLFLSYLLFGVRCPVLGAAGICVDPGLGFR